MSIVWDVYYTHIEYIPWIWHYDLNLPIGLKLPVVPRYHFFLRPWLRGSILNSILYLKKSMNPWTLTQKKDLNSTVIWYIWSSSQFDQFDNFSNWSNSSFDQIDQTGHLIKIWRIFFLYSFGLWIGNKAQLSSIVTAIPNWNCAWQYIWQLYITILTPGWTFNCIYFNNLTLTGPCFFLRTRSPHFFAP